MYWCDLATLQILEPEYYFLAGWAEERAGWLKSPYYLVAEVFEMLESAVGGSRERRKRSEHVRRRPGFLRFLRIQRQPIFANIFGLEFMVS